MELPYDVFISHAGEDKDSLAVPIYENLSLRGISAFLDREELRTGGDAPSSMLKAVDASAIGLIILSPDYGVKKWPMLELKRFLKNAKNAEEAEGAKRRKGPILIPIFYRFSVADCKDRVLFRKFPAFWEKKDLIDRMESGETNMKDILDSLQAISKRTGVENKIGATNEKTDYMRQKRDRLVDNVCEQVSQALGDLRREGMGASLAEKELAQQEDVFRASFFVHEDVEEVLLDFSSALKQNEAITPEAKVLREVVGKPGTREKPRVVVIKGGGGVGKSCILRALGREEEVKRRFPGGVYLLSLGMAASLDNMIEELLKILRLTGARRRAEQLAKEKLLDVILESLGDWMKGKRFLLLLDDLWDRIRIIGASVISRLMSMFGKESGSVLVVTTRFSSVASKGEVIEVKPLKPTSLEARSILLRYARFSEEEVKRWGVEWTVNDLLKICGGLPACLAAMGRGIAELLQHCGGDKGLAWKKYRGMISVKRIEVIQMGVDDYLDLNTTLSASLEVLEERNGKALRPTSKRSYAELHRSLSVFAKPAVVPIAVLCRLWQMEKEEEAWIIVKAFADVGVASIQSGGAEGMDSIQLHDLTHDFAIICAKVAGESSTWHDRLLGGYFKEVETKSYQDEPREWWKKADDAYIFRNVSRHLVLSGRIMELVLLLLKCEWAEVRHKRSGVIAWKGDFAQCLKALEESELKDKEAIMRGLSLIRDALVQSWSYLQGNWGEFGFQMWGRLDEKEEAWPVQRYLQSVKEYQSRPWLQPLNQNWREQGASNLHPEFALNHEVNIISHLKGSRYAVAAGSDISVIDLEDMCIVRRSQGHTDEVFAVGANVENETMISCSRDGTIRHWDLESGKLLHTKVFDESPKHENASSRFFCGAIDRKRTYVVTGSRDGKVDMWDLHTGKGLRSEFLVFSSSISCIEVSVSGKYIIAGSEDGAIQLWETSTGFRKQGEAWGHKGWVCTAVFSPDERKVATGSIDGTLRFWDIQSGSEDGLPIVAHNEWITCAAFTSDGQRIAVGSMDESVKVYNVETGEVICQYSQQRSAMVLCLKFGTHGDTLLFGSEDRRFRVWDISQSPDPKEERRPATAQAVTCLEASPNASFYVSGDYYGNLMVWDSVTLEPKGPVLKHDNSVWCADVSNNNRLIVSGSAGGAVTVWDVNEFEPVDEPIHGHSAEITSVAFSSDDRFIVSASNDQSVKVWKADDHTQVGMVVARRHKLEGLWSRIVALGSAIVGNWNSPVSRTFPRRYAAVPESVVVTPDSTRVITSWSNQCVWMWDLESGRVICEETGPLWGATRLTIEDNNRVVGLCYAEPPYRWLLDEKKGLVKCPRNENGNQIKRMEGENYTGQSEEIALTWSGRYLMWREDGRRLGTLPVNAHLDAWLYDSVRGQVVVGDTNGRVNFFKVVM